MEDIEIIWCKGCLGDFTASDISSDGYCEVCQYEFEQILDYKTDGDHE